MKPIAIVATHPIQYQGPLYRYLSAHGLPIRVFFLSDHGLTERVDVEFGRLVAWDIPLVDGYPHEFLPNLRHVSAAHNFLRLVNPSVVTRLLSKDFSAVLVHGYRNLSMLMAVGAGRLARIPVLYRSETSELARGAVKKYLAGPAFNSVVSACLSIGSRNDAFYDSLGVSSKRRFLVPYCVDNQRFQEAAAALSKAQSRSKLGLKPDGQVVLYAGKLVPWKQPDLLLRAFAIAAPPGAQLVFAGDGEMRAELEQWAHAHAPGQVTFVGFMNQSQITVAYRSADLLVLPSLHEPWGLVVNEVMNFGVPVLVSDQVGCGPDLVAPGDTGDVFPALSLLALVESLKHLLANADRLQIMGAKALTRIQHWGFAEAEFGIRAAVDSLGIRL